MARRTAPLLILSAIVLASAPALAQDPPSYEAPGHISFVDGSAVLERDGRIDSDILSMPLLAGDRVRTQAGRVEVLFVDGSALHLDADTVVDFQSDEVIRLLEGRIRLAIAGPSRDVSYRVDAPAAWVQINDPGEYRLGVLRNGDVELAVLRGAAELVNEQGRSFIRAGERTFAREGSAPSPPYVYNSAAWDEFDRWSEGRRDRRMGTSAQYLPSDVRPYAASFDTYGDWRYEQAYGYVWYPRVHVGWRPYHRGRWVSLRPYGWTWIAADPWGWPTHHYGRWGISAGTWFWIPGRHWGPAWVSWAYAPDYVSWCPLGWNNRPVLQIVNINAFGGRRYSPWDAWTVIPRRHFSGGYVNVASVTTVRIDQRVRNTFVVRDSAPETRHAVGRSPIRSTGRYAVPRGSVPGTYATDSTITGRTSGERTVTGGDRRSPAVARSPRTASSTPTESDQARSQVTRGTGERAVPRERSAPDQGVSTWRSGPVEGRSTEPVENRRAPAVRRRSGDPSDRPVTSAPTGAVRAVPRARQPADSATGVYSGERTRVREERPPEYSAPSPNSTPARPSQSDPGAYRSNPGYRRAPEAGSGTEYRRAPDAGGASGYRRPPDSGGEYRGRAVPRNEGPASPPPSAAPPSYRSAPEQRRGPSGPPPSAGPSQESRPSRESGEAGSGSRQRSGDGPSSGQARRRR